MKRVLWAFPVAVVAASVATVASAQPPSAPALTGLSAANTKSPGYAPASRLSPELSQTVVAQGAMKLENPSAPIAYYGYYNDGPMLPAPGGVQAPATTSRRARPSPTRTPTWWSTASTAPTRLRLRHALPLPGPRARRRAGYITRINLDADAAHRVTLLAETDSDGTPVPTIDGSTWDPFAQRLLFTTEGGATAPTYAATADYPSTVDRHLGRRSASGGYEGIQNDCAGNICIVEDIGGAETRPAPPPPKRPNSFIYRYVPDDAG